MLSPCRLSVDNFPFNNFNFKHITKKYCNIVVSLLGQACMAEARNQGLASKWGSTQAGTAPPSSSCRSNSTRKRIGDQNAENII